MVVVRVGGVRGIGGLPRRGDCGFCRCHVEVKGSRLVVGRKREGEEEGGGREGWGFGRLFWKMRTRELADMRLRGRFAGLLHARPFFDGDKLRAE